MSGFSLVVVDGEAPVAYGDRARAERRWSSGRGGVAGVQRRLGLASAQGQAADGPGRAAAKWGHWGGDVARWGWLQGAGR